MVVRPETADSYQRTFERIWERSKNQGSTVITRETLLSFLLESTDSKDSNRTNEVKAALDFTDSIYLERF
jgi:hypothetical protein